MKINRISFYVLFTMIFFIACQPGGDNPDDSFFNISGEELRNKIRGAWALQTIGVTYGGPTEFRYRKIIIPDSVEIHWSDTMMYHWMTRNPGLYDDIYMDLTFVDVLEKEGLDAEPGSFGEAYANAAYWLWHANQQGRYNILNGIQPPASGHWLNNPHADDIDFQIEADFAGIMSPGMPNTASEICDRVGHIMNSGDGYYGGVYVAAMYSNAFILDDVEEVVVKSLEAIPGASTYYQCISDVISWYRQYPADWTRTWQLVEDKWGWDIGCPDGVDDDFNIDAKINSAYVIIGLLYGGGDLERTMEISTRCGQDSDCNPASAAGILGAMIGYDAIPRKWSAGLPAIEDMDFKYTTISLNKVYELSYQHALELIERNGGTVDGEKIQIRVQQAEPVPLEQNFTGYQLAGNVDISRRITSGDPQEFSFDFEGTGVVLRGGVGNKQAGNQYALQSPEETLANFALDTDFYIDNELVKSNRQPLAFIERNHELFFVYELDPGKHTLTMKIKNPREEVYLDIQNVLVYKK
ncbi:MAG: ADP-ribosylglycohydrolase family protein [Cyclobacteriaceae bacterium]|nr:ADP-ribosylglycohydrolase family protein [Cyclobacteriaceae bacterium]